MIWNNPGLGYDPRTRTTSADLSTSGPTASSTWASATASRARSDDLTNVFGKILRINTNGTVPTDNPFYDGAGPNIDEIWAYGLRNPYRTNFDHATGLYWIGDVGGNVDAQAYEEVDIVERGKRYGWPDLRGSARPAQERTRLPGRGDRAGVLAIRTTHR